MSEKQGVFQGLILPGCRFAPVFAEGRGQLREGAAVGHGSSGSTARCNGITSSTIPPCCCELSLEAPPGQVCLTPVRGCSSWCTSRQCFLLSTMLGSRTPFGGQPGHQRSPYHPIALRPWPWRWAFLQSMETVWAVPMVHQVLAEPEAEVRAPPCSKTSIPLRLRSTTAQALGMQPLAARARHTLCLVSLGTKSMEAFVYPLSPPAVVWCLGLRFQAETVQTNTSQSRWLTSQEDIPLGFKRKL